MPWEISTKQIKPVLTQNLVPTNTLTTYKHATPHTLTAHKHATPHTLTTHRHATPHTLTTHRHTTPHTLTTHRHYSSHSPHTDMLLLTHSPHTDTLLLRHSPHRHATPHTHTHRHATPHTLITYKHTTPQLRTAPFAQKFVKYLTFLRSHLPSSQSTELAFQLQCFKQKFVFHVYEWCQRWMSLLVCWNPAGARYVTLCRAPPDIYKTLNAFSVSSPILFACHMQLLTLHHKVHTVVAHITPFWIGY